MSEYEIVSKADKSHSLIDREEIDATNSVDGIFPINLEVESCDNKKGGGDYRIDYKLFQWIFIIFFTLIAVIDRFTLNLWPLWVSSPGPTIPGNFSVSCFTLVSWISSRIMLVSSSYIFLFECRVFWNWFVERKFVHQYLKIGDIHRENTNIHFHVGWALIGIPVVLHVWLIMFAAAFPQNDIYVYDSWMRPNNPDTGKSIAFFKDNLLSLGINDIYRICSTSLAFFVLIPYSIYKWTRDHNWSLAQYLHLFGAMIYTVDLIRMKSHPHCWFFNLPFIAWWICDRFYGIFYYRRCVANIVRKIHLDSQYVILYLRIPERLHLLHNIGDVFYLNQLICGWDKAHPFTVFQNHKKNNKMINEDDHLETKWGGHKFSIYNLNDDDDDDDESKYIMSRQDTVTAHSQNNKDGIDIAAGILEEEYKSKELIDDNSVNIKDENDWNVGVIMQIFPDHTDCYHRKTWTKLIYLMNLRYLSVLRCWGPYRSEYRLLMNSSNDNKNNKYPSTPLVLIGTGAGCSFLIDFYNYFLGNNIKLDEMVYFYFSTRSVSMFQWFTDITCHHHINNFNVNAHLTSNDNITYKKKTENKSRESNIGRLSFQEILKNTKPNTNVYFCGAPNVQQMVKELCQKLSLTFHAGHSFH